jgi:hypothetical protein
MRRKSKSLFILAAAALFVIMVTPLPAPASSFPGYWIPDAGYPPVEPGVLDTGVAGFSLRYRALEINDLKAEAAIQQDRELNKPIADFLSPIRPKSPGKAFLLSAAVPGTGELYSKAKRGLLFTAAEVAFWTAYVLLHGQGEDLKEDYLEYCDEHIVFEEDSPASSTENWTLEDYEHATQSDNWHYVYTESNGKPLERVGKFYWADLPEDMIDQPGYELVSQFRAEAFKKRGSTNDKFKQAKVFLGLVVLNHIVSAVDARIAATMYNNRISEAGVEVSLYPTASPSGSLGACLTLHGMF